LSLDHHRNNSSSKRRPAAISVPKAEAAAQIGSVSPILRLGNLSSVANGTLVLPLMSREIFEPFVVTIRGQCGEEFSNISIPCMIEVVARLLFVRRDVETSIVLDA
jgi:hypothetical protein